MNRFPLALFLAAALAASKRASGCERLSALPFGLSARERQIAERGASCANANAIVYGLVTRVDLPLAESGSFEYSVVATIHVIASWKVATDSVVTVSTSIDGGTCGFPFQAGRHFLLFLHNDPEHHYRTTICSGSEPVDSGDRIKAYLPDLGEPLVAYRVPKIGI